MTCIVGIIEDNELWMGADTQASDSTGFKVHRKDEKVFEKEGFLIAFCGSYRLGQVVQYEFEIPELEEDAYVYMVTKFVKNLRVCLEKSGIVRSNDNIISLEGNILCGFYDLDGNARLFTIEVDLQVSENIDFFASEGSGQKLALASLFTTKDMNMKPKDRLLKSLETANYYDCYVGGEYSIKFLNEKKPLKN